MTITKNINVLLTIDLTGISKHSKIDIYISKEFIDYTQVDIRYSIETLIHPEEKGYDAMVLLTGFSHGFLSMQTLPSENQETYYIVTEPDKEPYRVNQK